MIVVSCVPKATENKAICGVNQAFNSVTRSCYSISEIRYKPVATKSSDTLTQETAKTITLTYTDGNSNPALSCRVSSLSSNIIAVSPQVTSGNVFTQANLLKASMSSLIAVMPLGAPKTAATADYASMTTNIALAQASYNYSNVIAGIDGLVGNAADILLQANSYNSVSFPSVQFFYSQASALYASFLPISTLVDNHCDCNAGICTTSIAPQMFKSGAAGFTYTVTDQDGESESKAVSLSISALTSAQDSNASLIPAATSSVVTFSESATSTASTYTILMPAGSDYLATAANSYSYTITSAPSHGTISNCRIIGINRYCDYTPSNGDGNSSGVPATATATVSDLTLTARAAGVFANSYSIQLFDLTAAHLVDYDSFNNTLQNFGLVANNSSDAYIRVVGNAVKVFIHSGVTTSAQIATMLALDPKASAMFTTTGGSSTTPSATSVVGFTGGADNAIFDKFSYSVNNGHGASTNSATVLIRLTPTEDPPVWNYVGATTTATVLEDSGAITINLSSTYTDAENNVNACNIDSSGLYSSGSFLANFTINSCTCVANVCTAVVTPNANVSSLTAFTFAYRVASAGLYTSYRNFSVNITPVNDMPDITTVLAAQTILENSTSAPSAGAYTVTATTGDAVWESAQVLTMTASSSNTTLLPNTACQNYTPGSGSPISSLTPSASGQYYFDILNKICYVSTGTTSTSWTYYPSLTVIPTCSYTGSFYRAGAPTIAPTAAGQRFLDTTNNVCYLSTGTTSFVWNKETNTQFAIAYVPTPNKSGTSTITLTLKDDGGTTNGGIDTMSPNKTFTLNVTSVDDPPYFMNTITSVQTNEGGAVVAGPFQVNEDQGDSSDEDVQAVKITSITSDNSAILPSTGISIFYDLNDNGVEDTGESRAIGATLEASAADDVKAHKFYLKLNPIAGVSGNSNITVTINDGNAAASHYVSTQFSLIVNPVAALHGGWANISATGIKTDKNGAPAKSSDFVCNYNKAADLNKCDTATTNCTGSTPPNSYVTPSAANVLYWDSSAQKCYRSQGSDKYSWIEFETSCPITRVTGSLTGLCSGENCISSSALTASSSSVGKYYYNTSTSSCYLGTEDTSTYPSTYAWTTKYVPSKITLAWNPFIISGSGADSTVQISGWNVYRREKGYDYNFTSGFLKINSTDTMTISDYSTRTFTDSTAVAGKVYYYLVRPVDSKHNFATYTPEVFSEVRVYAPTSNYAFVHRWMVNQEMCNSMHMTTTTTNHVDPTHNYRCPYYGPGESVATPGYYDIGKDMLVDIAEAGCPYSPAPECSALTGCIGIGDPTTLTAAGTISAPSTNSIYYDRSSGSCYAYNGGWTSYNPALFSALTASLKTAMVANTNTSLNPPLVNISQANATAVCAQRTTTTATGGLTGALAIGTNAAVLPTKKEFIAYSAAPSSLGDSAINDLETGYSLNVNSRCNSSSANGLESSFTDSSIPSTSFNYSVSGTSSSGIRSLYTGSIPWVLSAGTESCSSRYGIQDVYGNVAEWVQERMRCDNIVNTKLTAAVNLTDTTLHVASTAFYPIGAFISIGSEEMQITATTASTMTVTRASSSTTAATHSVSEYVYLDGGWSQERVCRSIAGSGSAQDLYQYDFSTGITSAFPSPNYVYSFDLVTGPYNDSNGDSLASQADSFLTNWLFRDEYFGAGKFSFPVGMPIYTDIATTVLSTSPALSSFLDIGPTSGITTSQLHEDGIIVNGIKVNDMVTNPNRTAGWAQGGSYLSGNFSGRYSSELVPDGTSARTDIGFRCYIPVAPLNYPTDPGRHTYSY